MLPSNVILWNHSFIADCSGDSESPSSAPVIVVAPVDHKVIQDGVASFYCRAAGNPIPEVSWRRAGRRIVPNRQQRFLIVSVTPGSSVLRIDAARARDAGQYECRADNGFDSPATATVQLDVITDSQTGTAMTIRIDHQQVNLLRVK